MTKTIARWCVCTIFGAVWGALMGAAYGFCETAMTMNLSPPRRHARVGNDTTTREYPTKDPYSLFREEARKAGYL